MKVLRFVILAIVASTTLFAAGQSRGGAQGGRLGQPPGPQQARPQQPRPQEDDSEKAKPKQGEPQEPIATFRAGVRAIQVDAVVTDEDGNPVRGLTADDFELTEKGRPQAITTFEAVDIPIEEQPPDLADSDVVTNEGDGRIYLIVLDAISAANATLAKRELRTFFDDHFGPSDVAAVMLLDRGDAKSGQDFTSNRRLLIQGIDRFIGYNENEAGEAVVPGSASPFSGPTERPAAGTQSAGASARYESQVLGSRNRMGRLKDLTEFLIKTPGRRKAMILVSEAIGFDATDFQDYKGTAMNPAAQLAHAAMTAATRGNIAIYPIHPGGASPGMVLSGPDTGTEIQDQRVGGQSATMELRTIADATGGFAHVNSNNFDDSFTRLVQEQSVYYMLGFNSSQDKDDGLYVPVKLTVKRPGLKVHAREGYIAPFKGKDNVTSPERTPGVGAALASPIPVGGVTIRAFAAPFKGKGKTAAIVVALEMDPQQMGLAEEANGSLRGLIDLRLVATDVRAKVLPQIRQVGNISVPPDSRAEVEREGLHILTKTDLEPGRYQLRIALGTAQRGGSVIYDLDVPDFSKKELSMSGVVLRGPSDPEGVFLPAGDPLQALAIQAPTTVRVFRDGDRVAVFAEIYDTTGGRAHTIDVRAVLRNEAGDVTPVGTASRSSDELTKTGAMRFDAQLPIAKLSAGRYVLSLEAKSSAGGEPVVRTIPFRVR
jgi:VWFA-related protein